MASKDYWVENGVGVQHSVETVLVHSLTYTRKNFGVERKNPRTGMEELSLFVDGKLIYTFTPEEYELFHSVVNAPLIETKQDIHDSGDS